MCVGVSVWVVLVCVGLLYCDNSPEAWRCQTDWIRAAEAGGWRVTNSLQIGSRSGHRSLLMTDVQPRGPTGRSWHLMPFFFFFPPHLLQFSVFLALCFACCCSVTLINTFLLSGLPRLFLSHLPASRPGRGDTAVTQAHSQADTWHWAAALTHGLTLAFLHPSLHPSHMIPPFFFTTFPTFPFFSPNCNPSYYIFIQRLRYLPIHILSFHIVLFLIPCFLHWIYPSQSSFPSFAFLTMLILFPMYPLQSFLSPFPLSCKSSPPLPLSSLSFPFPWLSNLFSPYGVSFPPLQWLD